MVSAAAAAAPKADVWSAGVCLFAMTECAFPFDVEARRRRPALLAGPTRWRGLLQ
jgi:hypothetical protein